MPDIRTDQRRFTRVALDVPVDIHQGGSIWRQRLIAISLSGVSTDQPDVWDAQYNEPFTLIIHLEDTDNLELHAFLQHVEAGTLGFAVDHIDRTNIGPLRMLLEARIGNYALLEEELTRLEN